MSWLRKLFVSSLSFLRAALRHCSIQVTYAGTNGHVMVIIHWRGNEVLRRKFEIGADAREVI